MPRCRFTFVVGGAAARRAMRDPSGAGGARTAGVAHGIRDESSPERVRSAPGLLVPTLAARDGR